VLGGSLKRVLRRGRAGSQAGDFEEIGLRVGGGSFEGYRRNCESLGGELEGEDGKAESEESGPESRRAHLNGRYLMLRWERRDFLSGKLVLPDGLLRGGRSLRDFYIASLGASVGREGIFCADHREAPGESGTHVRK
jgi:hypothetical protein